MKISICLTIILLICSTRMVHGRDEFEGGNQMLELADDDGIELKIEQSPYEEGSSGEDGNGTDLITGYWTPAEILALVICGIAGLAIVVFAGACIWHKVKVGRSSSFMQVTLDDEDDTLYMVDYDVVNIEHGRLAVQTSPAQPFKENKENF